MRFVGFQEGGRSVVGALVGADGPGQKVVGLAPVEDFYADLTGWTEAARQAVADPGSGARPVAAVTLVPPVPPAARVLCVGLNYRDHAAETGQELPRYPTIFGRWTVSLTVDGTPAPVPAGERGLDWEAELGAVVGVTLADADERTALAGVFGYAAFNDLSARRAQGRSPQWTLGKNADFSGPLGPVVTADEVGDPAEGLSVRTRIRTRADDGSVVEEVVQDGTTADMIFSVGEVLAFVSKTITLHPGDLLVTGTPAGVGFVRRPPRYLTPGDWVQVEIDRVGQVSTPVVDASGRG